MSRRALFFLKDLLIAREKGTCHYLLADLRQSAENCSQNHFGFVIVHKQKTAVHTIMAINVFPTILNNSNR